MLTSQMIGASHNASAHAPRPATAEPPTQATPVAQAQDQSATQQLTPRAVPPTDSTEQTQTAFADRPPLQTPKRAEMQVAVIDSMPDVVPESIYKAKLAEPEA
jgi:hypothetical protein